MKKISNIFFSSILVLFSFFYTNNLILFMREKDPISLKLKEIDEGLTVVEASIFDSDVIPGIHGSKIDFDKSYLKMKKIGKFDKNLIIYKEVMPVYSINNNYDKNIVAGSKLKNSVSLIFEVSETSYIEELLSILNKKEIPATFFISKEVFDNSIDIVKLIKSFKNDIELLSDKYTIYEVNKYNSLLKLVSNDNLSLCLNKGKQESILNNCESSKLHSIVPTIIANNYLYTSVKNKLYNGSIILVDINSKTLKELSSTINYIQQKGKKIILLNDLIQE